MPEEEQFITVRQAESGQAVEYKLKVMQSECIPAVYVDTDSHSMQYLEQDKEHEEMINEKKKLFQVNQQMFDILQ